MPTDRSWAGRGVVFVVIALAGVFGLVNGIHDAGNAIAAPVVTRALRPGRALALAAAFHLAGAFTVGTAVAATIAGIVAIPHGQLLAVVGAAASGAIVWSGLTLWWGLPCSSGHTLVGALAGAALAEGGAGAVRWGGLHGVRPEGVAGSLVWLAFSALVALPLSYGAVRLARRSLRRAARSVEQPVRGGEIVTSAALAFAHGSNDAQKTMGLIAAALVGAGRLPAFEVPLWVVAVGAGCLTLGTSMGGWRVAQTLGKGIYRLRPLDGLVSQGASSAVVLAASLAGAPVSTTDVVAPSVVGVGAGQRWRRVRWSVVREISLAWLVTLPVAGALGALALPLWRYAA